MNIVTRTGLIKELPDEIEGELDKFFYTVTQQEVEDSGYIIPEGCRVLTNEGLEHFKELKEDHFGKYGSVITDEDTCLPASSKCIGSCHNCEKYSSCFKESLEEREPKYDGCNYKGEDIKFYSIDPSRYNDYSKRDIAINLDNPLSKDIDNQGNIVFTYYSSKANIDNIIATDKKYFSITGVHGYEFRNVRFWIAVESSKYRFFPSICIEASKRNYENYYGIQNKELMFLNQDLNLRGFDTVRDDACRPDLKRALAGRGKKEFVKLILYVTQAPGYWREIKRVVEGESNLGEVIAAFVGPEIKWRNTNYTYSEVIFKVDKGEYDGVYRLTMIPIEYKDNLSGYTRAYQIAELVDEHNSKLGFKTNYASQLPHSRTTDKKAVIVKKLEAGLNKGEYQCTAKLQ